MSLISVEFAAFAAAILIIYYLVPHRFRWWLLLAASVAFYLFAGPKYVVYVAVTAVVTWGSALLCRRSADRFAASLPELKKTLSRDEVKALSEKAEKKRRWWLRLSLAVNFGILIVIKYLDFLLGNVNALFGTGLGPLGLVMPLGLSYYTFAAVGYAVDVNRGKYAPERNFARFFLFLTYFPQMIQGPIPRYDRLSAELTAERKFEFSRLRRGFELIVWGLFKKLIIADALAPLVGSMSGPDGAALTGCELWVGMIAWGMELYTDFSGGIDIVRGLSQCFGIELEENFRRPYFAKDLTEYWDRWHISLSNWLRDYMFYPIALSKRFARFSKFLKKKFGKFIAKTIPVGLCSLLLFTVIGVWHGANWGEVLFGVFNGVVILISTLCEPLFERIRKPLKMDTLPVWRVFRSVRTFLLITLIRVISRAPDIPSAFSMYGRMLFSRPDASGMGEWIRGTLPAGSLLSLLPALCGCLVLFFVGLAEERSESHSVRDLLDRRSPLLRAALCALCLITVAVFGSYGLGYDAGAFIYTQY